MLFQLKMGAFFIVLAFLVTAGLLSDPDDYPDISGDYILDVIIGDSPPPKYSRTSLALKDDIDNDSEVTSLSSDVGSSLDKNMDNDIAVEAFQDLKATNAIVDDPVVERTLADLLLLSKIMDRTMQYVGSLKEDPKRPSSFTSKVGSKVATPQENQAFQQDVTGIVILQMMEEQATFLNNYVQDRMSTTEAEVNLTTLFGGSDSVKVVDGLLSLKYLEGLLHAANIMINGSMLQENDGGSSTGEQAASEMRPLLPSKVETKDKDNLEASLGPFIILTLSAIGFFFVLFLIIYTAYKLIQTCYEARTVRLDGWRKRKYERI